MDVGRHRSTADVVHDVEGLDLEAADRESKRRITEVRAEIEDGPRSHARGKVREKLVVLLRPEEPLPVDERSQRFEVDFIDVRLAEAQCRLR